MIECTEGHYEVQKVSYGEAYVWCPEHVLVECDCGERLILTAASTVTTCRRCGADLGDTFVHFIQEREGRLPDKLTHPWFYDAKARAHQHQEDEAAHPEGSPWRYTDITEAP